MAGRQQLTSTRQCSRFCPGTRFVQSAKSYFFRIDYSHIGQADVISRHPRNAFVLRRAAEPAMNSARGETAGQPLRKTAEIVTEFALRASFHSLRDVQASIARKGRNANKMNRRALQKVPSSRIFLKILLISADPTNFSLGAI